MTDKSLSHEKLQAFEAFFQTRLLQAGGGQSYERDAEIIRDMLRSAQQGHTPTSGGGEAQVRPLSEQDYADPDTIDALQVASGGGRAASSDGGRSPKDMLLGVAVLVALIAGGVWWLWPRNGATIEADTTTLETVITTTVTAQTRGTPTPLPTLEADLLADIIGNGVSTGLVAPRTLEIGGVSFVVQPVKVDKGDWPLPDDERAVSWVAGTVVNYVMGLDATADNKTLIAALRPGDEFRLRLSTGELYRFAFVDMVSVAPQSAEVFAQTRPGLTVALVGDEAQSNRMVGRAVYLPDSEISGGSVVGRGTSGVPGTELYPIAGLSLRVIAAAPWHGQTPPPHHRYLAVDYTLTNDGPGVLLPGPLWSQLEAEGVVYAPAFGLRGTDYPPLPATVAAGETVTATAVYAVPEMVVRGGVWWVFTPNLANAQPVRVALPGWQGSFSPVVSIERSQVYPTGTLTIDLAIHNPTGHLQITAAEIGLTGAQLHPTSNLPWQIAAGETTTRTLSLTPQQDRVRLRVWSTEFELLIEQVETEAR